MRSFVSNDKEKTEIGDDENFSTIVYTLCRLFKQYPK